MGPQRSSLSSRLEASQSLSPFVTPLNGALQPQEDRLTLAHVGDSRGVLCRGGTAIELTRDHKPVKHFDYTLG